MQLSNYFKMLGLGYTGDIRDGYTDELRGLEQIEGIERTTLLAN